MLVPEWSINVNNETIRLYNLEPLRVKMGELSWSTGPTERIIYHPMEYRPANSQRCLTQSKPEREERPLPSEIVSIPQ